MIYAADLTARTARHLEIWSLETVPSYGISNWKRQQNHPYYLGKSMTGRDKMTPTELQL